MQQDLAERVGSRREVVSRALRRLEKDELVEKTRGALVLTGPGVLNRRITLKGLWAKLNERWRLVPSSLLGQSIGMDMRKFILAAVIGLLPAATLHAAGAEDAAFDGDCVMGLAFGKDIHTDCSVNTVYKGTKYCFGNETARTLFLKRPDDFLLQAYVYHSTREAQDADAADGGK